MRAAILVTHLLGTGHLARAARLADGMTEAGHEVLVLSGGTHAPNSAPKRAPLHQLPAVEADGPSFNAVLRSDSRKPLELSETSCVFRGSTAEALAGLLDGFDGVVSFDPNIRPQVFPNRAEWLAVANRWLDRADVIKASDEDMDWIGVQPADLLARGAAVVLRTTGGTGVDGFLADGSEFHVPAQQVDVVDTVGAGDSFCGATLVRLHRAGCLTPEAVAALDAETWRSIVTYAVRAAAVTVSRLGADPPWANELTQ